MWLRWQARKKKLTMFEAVLLDMERDRMARAALARKKAAAKP